MSENPYEAPKSLTEVTGVLSGSREDLQRVARYQRVILVCILLYVLAVVGQSALPPELRKLLALGVLLVVIVGAVFVFRLAMKTHGTGLGVVLGLLSLVPLLGLFVLLMVNGKATTVLQQNGIKVGLLGANPNTI